MENISVETLKERLEAGEKINLVDVREPDERAAFHIGGQHVALGRINNMDTDEIDHLKNQEVICYCRSGQRSARACMMLETLGFTQVKNLTGGVLAWQEKYGSA